MRIIKFFGPALATVLALVSCSTSTTSTLRGNEARLHAGDGSDLFEPGEWSTLALRDRRSAGLIAVIFNPGGGTFRTVKRDLIPAQFNPYNLVVLNDPAGDGGFAPTPELLGEIREAGLVPEIIIGPDGREAARIYRDPIQTLNARVQDDGRVRLELGRRSDRGGGIAYSLPLFGVATPAPVVGPTPIPAEGDFVLGQAVTWLEEGTVRVGSVKAFLGDGTALINAVSADGMRPMIISLDLLSPVGPPAP